MTVTSLCLGIDVSPRRLGWALARLEDGAPVACGVEAIDLPDHGWDRERVVRAMRRVQDAGRAGDAETRWYFDAEVHYVAIERPALPPKSGTNAAFNAGRAYQEAISAVRRRWPWAVVDEMQPGEWRRLAGLAGNASKYVVLQQAMESGFSKCLVGMNLALQQDAADAACIALAGVERNRQTLGVGADLASLREARARALEG
ncbi:MAG TPA: hypothetical protein VJP59_03420 [Gemmatimonadota bacterium]|nr:hypothetical protein [Gemmatimonadota bacterium]